MAHKAPPSHNKQGSGIPGDDAATGNSDLQLTKQAFLKSRGDDLSCGGFAEPRLPEGSLSFPFLLCLNIELFPKFKIVAFV